MPLRDGAYLLPDSQAHASALADVAEDCLREGGTAWLVDARPHTADDAMAWRTLFDRRDDYDALREGWKALAKGLGTQDAAELSRLRRKAQRDLDTVRAIDFFPGEASVETEVALAEFIRRIDAVLSPDEPREARGGIARLDPAHYRGRTWATRRSLWVDRVASAWLIRRFIDPDAAFLWLARPADCPKKALGFDFDGAAFTHVRDRVTFETLMVSFGLDGDGALARIGAMVHQLDVGGEPVPEAVGFEAVMTGARERLPDDDTLLAEMSSVLDSLYAHFQRATAADKTRSGRTGR